MEEGKLNQVGRSRRKWIGLAGLAAAGVATYFLFGNINYRQTTTQTMQKDEREIWINNWLQEVYAEVPEAQKYSYSFEIFARHLYRTLTGLWFQFEREDVVPTLRLQDYHKIIMDEISIPRARFNIEIYEKGERLQPLSKNGSELKQIWQDDSVIFNNHGSSFFSIEDGLFNLTALELCSPTPVEGEKCGPFGLQREKYLEIAAANTKNMMTNQNSLIYHSRVWRDLQDEKLQQKLFERPSNYEEIIFGNSYRMWFEVYLPTIWTHGSFRDKLLQLLVIYGVINNKWAARGLGWDEIRRDVSKLAAESVGDTVYDYTITVPGRELRHGDLIVPLSDKLFDIYQSNKANYNTPIKVNAVNGLPFLIPTFEDFVKDFEGQDVSEPFFEWFNPEGLVESIRVGK